jgi:hypothetical protein
VPHLIAILEDDPRRVAEMRRCVALLGGSAECVFRASAPDMIALLEERASETALVSLDHHLVSVVDSEGRLVHPGTGSDVAEWIAARGPACPVLVHTSSSYGARDMLRLLEAAGLRAERITPHSGLGWVEASWLPAVIERLPLDGE